MADARLDERSQIIPRAIDYFTGKALEYEDGMDDMDDDEFDDEEDEDEDVCRRQSFISLPPSHLLVSRRLT